MILNGSKMTNFHNFELNKTQGKNPEVLSPDFQLCYPPRGTITSEIRKTSKFLIKEQRKK